MSPSLPRLVVLISGSGSNLQAIIDAVANGTVGAEIAGVISNKPGVAGLDRAERAGIPAKTIDHRNFASRETFDQALASAIEQFRPDLVLLAGFMRILTSDFVRRFHGRLMNIHPSLLPRYTGLHTHQRAIDAGDTEAGATVHFVTEQLDGGPPIIQARVPVRVNDTAEQLAARVLVAEHRIYPLAVQWFCEGRLRMTAAGVELDNNLMPPTGYPFNDPAGSK